ncbi:MAG: SUMF1/EgtB/PvdO family nonheme iron enzyme [Chloroflexi bacterium]|nr:SUMF1/EgtB/PvdO family nonheme iron enzyme [Chloroflexota bacterium]
MSEKQENLQAELAKLERAINETAARLFELLPEEDVRTAVAPLREKQARIMVELKGSGGMAAGSGTAVGERGIHAGDARGSIISGDNNSVNHIINYYHSKPENPELLREQTAAYLSWLLDSAGTIELRGIKREGQQVVQLDLETVYVPLTATTYREDKRRGMMGSGVPQDIDLNDVWGHGKRIIVTGGPGCGKTTVLLHIAWALAAAIYHDNPPLAAEKIGLTGDLPLPIFVPLSAYADHLRKLARVTTPTKPNAHTLASFISRYLIEKQSSFSLPDDFFQRLLQSGQSVMLLLDGLDEVPEEALRVKVRQAIEELTAGREQMRIAVTCRTAAYQGRTALGKGFREIKVKPLDEAHIKNLIRQAYASIYQHDPGLRAKKTQELLSGIERLEGERRRRLGKDAPRLIDSPLLARMLLVVHFSERRLPEQRAELYMKATDAMLLPEYGPDAAVADRIGGLVGGSREAHRDLVQHLAFHMHSQGDKKGREIDEGALRRLLVKEPSYAPHVDDFIALTRLRGTLLEERLGMYRFLHLGFQEFLAARYLAEIVRGEAGAAGIAAFLERGASQRSPILDSWWREPALLASGYLSVASPQTAQTLLRRMAGLDEKGAARHKTLSPDVQMGMAEAAAAACMEWQTPPEKLQRDLAARIVALFADDALMGRTKPRLKVEAGIALGYLGDPRPGVCSLEPKLIPIKAGAFLMGDEKYTIKLEAFHIAQYPVTNAQYRLFTEDGGYTAQWRDCWTDDGWAWREEENRNGPYAWGEKYSHPNQPAVGVTWYEAVAYAAWLQRKTGRPYRLPTEAEWERAARHTDGRSYPWGDEWRANAANSKEINLKQTAPVGAFPQGTAVCGAADMSGNVWEWCSSRWRDENGKNYPLPYRGEDGREQLAGGNDVWRLLRGGAYFSNKSALRCAYRSYYDPHGGHYNIGFRVVASPFIPPPSGR